MKRIGWLVPLRAETESAIRAAITIPCEILELRSTTANALAFPGRTDRIIFTSATLAQLSTEEAVAIAKHEAGHLAEANGTKRLRVRVATVVTLLVAGSPIASRVAGTYGLLGILLAIAMVMFIARRLLRDTEKHADDHGAEGDAPLYARALESTYRSNMIPAVLGGKGGLHGHLYDRITRTGVAPQYARPLRPPRPWQAFIVIPLLAASHLLPSVVRDDFPWALAVTGASPLRVLDDANIEEDAHATHRALALFGSVADTLPDDPCAHAYVATAAAQDGDCALAAESSKKVGALIAQASGRLRCDTTALAANAQSWAEWCAIRPPSFPLRQKVR